MQVTFPEHLSFDDLQGLAQAAHPCGVAFVLPLSFLRGVKHTDIRQTLHKIAYITRTLECTASLWHFGGTQMRSTGSRYHTNLSVMLVGAQNAVPSVGAKQGREHCQAPSAQVCGRMQVHACTCTALRSYPWPQLSIRHAMA